MDSRIHSIYCEYMGSSDRIGQNVHDLHIETDNVVVLVITSRKFVSFSV